MKLYLARHGDYALDTAQGLDVLTDQGRNEITQLATQLRQMNLQVENILHSEKNRAKQTAELLASGITSKEAPIVYKGLNPDDEVSEIAGEIPHWNKDLLIVGHLPFMSKLVSFLLIRHEFPEIVNFQTGTIACLGQIDKTQWAIDWVLSPSH